MAVAESGMGIVEDKVIKNHFASEYIYNAYKDEKTCGVLSEDDTFGTITIAEPIGIICGIVPTTQKKRFDDLIGHLHKNVLFAKWIILFEIDGLHRHALTLFGKGHHSNGAYSAAPDGWKR